MLTAGPAWTAGAVGTQTTTPRTDRGDTPGAPASPGSPGPLLAGAEEVLVLTGRADLGFVERCLRQARAGGARTTVLYDARAEAVPGDGDAALRDVLPVPVVARSGGGFRARVVIAASADGATVSIGSGDATPGGWGLGAEVWTHLTADGATVPTLITDLAAWLRRLPELLWIEPLGVERLTAVADLLSARPHAAEADEPLLLVNDEVPFVEQLPFAAGADRLGVAAGAFDAAGRAFAEIARAVRALQVRLLVPVGVRCDVAGLTAVLDEVGGFDETGEVLVQAATDRQYHGAGLLEWWSGDTGVLVTGGLECTPESLLVTSADPGGHVELGLLQEVTASLLDEPAAHDVALGDPGLAVRTPEPAGAAAARVLAVRLHADRVEAGLVAAGATAPDGLVATVGETSVKLPWTGAEGRLHTYVAEGATLRGRAAQIRAADGTQLGTAVVSDVAVAVTRYSRPSPLESRDLADVFGDADDLENLFAAVSQLASGRTQRYGTAPAERRAAEEERLRAIVGPALLDFAFGRTLVDAAGEIAIAVASMDAGQIERLRQQVLRLGGAASGWPLPARLTAFRIVLVLAAAGLWPAPQDWTPLLAAGLDALIAADDEAFAGEQGALATVGIAAVHHGHLLSPLGGFEDLRAQVRLDQTPPEELVAQYAEGLAGDVLGTEFQAAGIAADAGELLVRSPFDDAVDAIPESVGTVQRSDSGGVLVDTSKDPRRTTLLVLDLLRDFPDTHVTVRGSAGTETHGWWNGRRLVLLSPFGGRWRGSLWPGLITGIAMYAKGAAPLPAAARTWITEVAEMDEG
ncbi:hypothetical protein Dvina_28010 [Dactylosporangium vinaceum]|uniref:Uncharacterized protein n=1 Tax=Dactylosporangium vinaceum TaxID=53362 RepID=A0ABV5MCP4_9ACTN|nr:hypothetical protein [Dactylosporangium vinaceum]UAB92223.1 hypothetical protein Dvina_28010 [Dactylosporangium vinaceum]